MPTAAPDLQLLANGDILVPVEDGAGAWRMSRVAIEDAGYAEWLRIIQERDRDPGLLARGVSFWVSAVLVLCGLWAFFIIAVLVARAL
jgi:hypothetical protein